MQDGPPKIAQLSILPSGRSQSCLHDLQIDAFTSEAFRGNPAAVVFVHDQHLSDKQMQAIAAENNLSETAYLEHADPGKIADCEYFASSSKFRLR